MTLQVKPYPSSLPRVTFELWIVRVMHPDVFTPFMQLAEVGLLFGECLIWGVTQE